MKETYRMSIKIEDWQGATVFSKEFEGDAPHTYDFANFCHSAGIAYGFSENSMDNFIKYTWDYD